MSPPRMIAAEAPDRGRMYYLVDKTLDFVPEVKDFLDWKVATKRAPATVKAYCSRLEWYYCFLSHHQMGVLEATPSDLTEFVIWLCNPYRDMETMSPIHIPSPLTASSVNLILQSVGALYCGRRPGSARTLPAPSCEHNVQVTHTQTCRQS